MVKNNKNFVFYLRDLEWINISKPKFAVEHDTECDPYILKCHHPPPSFIVILLGITLLFLLSSRFPKEFATIA